MTKNASLLTLTISALLLSACGGDGSSSTPPLIPDEKPNIEHQQGRLLILTEDPSRPQLNLYDLAQKQTIHNTQLNSNPSGVYASAGYRYGVLMNRTQGVVNFYDSGLSLNKGNISNQTPQLLTYQLSGAAPTHYRNFNGQAAIFYDGSETETSKFDVFTDAGITSKNVASQKLPFKHHGVAEPLDEYVLSSYSGSGEALASVVRNFELHGDHFHGQNNLENTCPGLHGASSVKGYSAFGCEDGVLLVEHGVAGHFKDSKLPLDVRIGTVVGQANAKELVGLASTTPDLFIINGPNKRVQQISWADKDVGIKRLQQIYSQSGNYFVVLDSFGQLIIFDTESWTVKHRVQVINVQSPDLAKTQLVANGRADEVYLNDIENKSIIQVDLKTGTIKQTIQLNTVPNQFTWLGVGQV